MTNVIDLETRRPKEAPELTDEEVQELHDEVLDISQENFVGFCGVGILPSGEVTLASNIDNTTFLVGLLKTAIETVENRDKRI